MERLEDMQKKQEQVQQTAPAAEDGAVDNADAAQAEAFKNAINKTIQVIQWFVAVLEIALVIRFFFKLFGAAQDNPFVGFLYALTDVILFPFSTIFRPSAIHPNNVVEWSTVVGMVMIWLIYMAIRWLLRIVVSNPEEQAS